ncbi:MAG TPA: hypothetical protein PKY23_04740 [Bacillota bacterium]|nr:hypothetical protein [Bacillota bacterium]
MAAVRSAGKDNAASNQDFIDVSSVIVIVMSAADARAAPTACSDNRSARDRDFPAGPVISAADARRQPSADSSDKAACNSNPAPVAVVVAAADARTFNGAAGDNRTAGDRNFASVCRTISAADARAFSPDSRHKTATDVDNTAAFAIGTADTRAPGAAASFLAGYGGNGSALNVQYGGIAAITLAPYIDARSDWTALGKQKGRLGRRLNDTRMRSVVEVQRGEVIAAGDKGV